MAFEYNLNPSHSCVFQILDVARQRVEDGLPAYGKLREEASRVEIRRAIEERKKRMEGYHL